MAEQHEKTEVTCVYNVFDPDQTGHVSVIEIQEALHVWYGDRISEEEVQEISAFADLDNNGFVKEQGIIVLEQGILKVSGQHPQSVTLNRLHVRDMIFL